MAKLNALVVKAKKEADLLTWRRAKAVRDYIILTYLFTNLALPIYVWKQSRNELNVRSHIILPLLGSVALLLPLWGLIQPGQAWPLKACPWVALGALVVAGVYGAVLARRSPDLVHRIGAYVADE